MKYSKLKSFYLKTLGLTMLVLRDSKYDANEIKCTLQYLM